MIYCRAHKKKYHNLLSSYLKSVLLRLNEVLRPLEVLGAVIALVLPLLKEVLNTITVVLRFLKKPQSYLEALLCALSHLVPDLPRLDPATGHVHYKVCKYWELRGGVRVVMDQGRHPIVKQLLKIKAEKGKSVQCGSDHKISDMVNI